MTTLHSAPTTRRGGQWPREEAPPSLSLVVEPKDRESVQALTAALAEHSPWERSFEKLERQAPPAEQLRAAPELKQGRLRLVDGLVRGAHWPEAIAATTAKLGADPTRRFSALWALPIENPCLDRLE